VRWLAGALALVAGLAGAAAPPPPLTIAVRGPVFAGGELAVEVRRSGGLAERPVVVYLAVDGAAIERFPLDRPTQVIAAPVPELTAGRHEVLVKTGSLRATQTIRVWPRWTPAALLGVGLVVVAAALAARRRRSPR
jgi:hypothetical protein